MDPTHPLPTSPRKPLVVTGEVAGCTDTVQTFERIGDAYRDSAPGTRTAFLSVVRWLCWADLAVEWQIEIVDIDILQHI